MSTEKSSVWANLFAPLSSYLTLVDEWNDILEVCTLVELFALPYLRLFPNNIGLKPQYGWKTKNLSNWPKVHKKWIDVK